MEGRKKLGCGYRPFGPNRPYLRPLTNFNEASMRSCLDGALMEILFAMISVALTVPSSSENKNWNAS